jgi:DNA-binding SARP family transcriptional activator
MLLKILGPPELVANGAPVQLGGARQRVVLAVLALNANRVASVDQLVRAIWGTTPPTSARNQIQVCVSALRKLCDGTGLRIRTQPPGYLLEVPDGELDSMMFDQLVTVARAHAAEQRFAAAARDLTGALALWRGPALAGVPGDVVRLGAALFEERRMSALEERIRIELRLGRHGEAVAELRALVAQEPLRERLHQFLMLALYRCGRQAEALEAGRRARTLLVEEIGVEPGHELQDMATAILNRDPSLDLPQVDTSEQAAPAGGNADQPARVPAVAPLVPRQLPASMADFTGRRELLDQIKLALTEQASTTASAYAVRIVAVSGRGGVGKSSVVVQAAHELASAFPDGHLYAAAQSVDSDNTGKVLVRFLRALGVHGTSLPDDQSERVELYRSLLADKKVLIVLDGVTGEAEVLPLLPGTPTCAVLTTSRARLSGLPGAQLIDIEVLDVDMSVELIARMTGPDRVNAEPEASRELARLCYGLPLALRIAGARLMSRPDWRLGELVRRLRDETRRLDELAHHGLELRSSIGLSYGGLPDTAQRLFRLLGLIESAEFGVWAAAAFLDCGFDQADDVINNLIDSRLLEIVDYPAKGFRSYQLHDLVRVYAREQLAATESADQRRAALSRYCGAWLSLVEQSHRKEYGGDFTILHGTAPRWWLPDGPDSDLGDPTALLSELSQSALLTVVHQAAAEHMDELCWDLALSAVTLFETRGYFDEWSESARVALAATRHRGNRRGEAAMQYSLGSLYLAQKKPDQAESFLSAALRMFQALDDTHGCALVQRNLAHVDWLRGNTDVMLARYAEALAMSRAVGDLIAEAHILTNLARYHIGVDDHDQAKQLLDEAFAIGRELRCARVEAQVTYRFAELHLSVDDISSAREALHRTLRIVRDLGDRIGEAYTLYTLGVVRHREGRLDNARTTLSHALTLATQLGERWIEAQALYSLGEVELARRDTATAAGRLVAARSLFSELGAVLWQARSLVLLSEAHAALGDDTASHFEALQAAQLLATVDSGESTVWLARLRGSRTGLVATTSSDGLDR